MARTRGPGLGPPAHPVAVPEDIDRMRQERPRGAVELPFLVRWSGPSITYDLADRRDRTRVYEQVLRGGTDDDVLRFVDPDELIDLWDDLVLPPPVRRAWAAWFQRRRGISLAC